VSAPFPRLHGPRAACSGVIRENRARPASLQRYDSSSATGCLPAIRLNDFPVVSFVLPPQMLAGGRRALIGAASCREGHYPFLHSSTSTNFTSTDETGRFCKACVQHLVTFFQFLQPQFRLGRDPFGSDCVPRKLLPRASFTPLAGSWPAAFQARVRYRSAQAARPADARRVPKCPRKCSRLGRTARRRSPNGPSPTTCAHLTLAPRSVGSN